MLVDQQYSACVRQEAGEYQFLFYILKHFITVPYTFLSKSRLAHASCNYFFPFVRRLFNNSLFCLHIGLHTGYGLKKLQIRFFQIKKNFLMSVCLLFNLLPSYENFIQESLIMDSVKIGVFWLLLQNLESKLVFL